VWAPGRRQLTAGLIMAVTLVAFEALAVATILPVISHQLGDLRLYGWVFSAFLLSSVLGVVAGGALSDKRGIGLPVIGGLVVFAAGLTVAGFASDMPILVAGRIVQGFGAGLVPAAVYVAIGRAYPSSARPRMLALLSTAWVIPGLVGPAVAAQVATNFGWRWVFLGLLPLVAAAGIVTVPGLATVPPPSGEDLPPSPILPAVMASAGAGLILAGFSLANPIPTALLLGAGLVVLVPALQRLTPEGTLRARRGLPATLLVRGLLTFAYFAGEAYLPLTLTSVRHTSTTFAGLTLTVATMTWTAGAWLQARVVERTGPRVLIRGGLVLVVLALAGTASVLWARIPLWVAPLTWGLGGFGIGTAYSPTTLTALGLSTPGREGAATSGVQLMDLLGTAFGTGIAGAAVAAVHQRHGDPRLGLGIAFALAASVGVVGVLVTPRIPSEISPVAPR
jgi:MFS family permease